MTIYEAVKQIFESGYDGTKTTVFESDKGKVWIERSQDKVYAYLLYGGQMISARWNCGYLGGFGWTMPYTAGRTYNQWFEQVKKECA